MSTIIYHGGCVDGLVAAWAARLKFADAAAAEDVECVPAQYGSEPPDVTGRDVVIVDFSYPRDALVRMADAARSIIVLDHHKTARDALEGLPFCVFDMERSGAGLAWDILHPGKPRPWIVDYAEDRDLWRWKLPDSRDVNAWLQSIPLTLDAVGDTVAAGRDAALHAGRAVSVAQRRYIETAKTGARFAMVGSFGPVPVVNAGVYCNSEVVGELAVGHPFAAAWVECSNGTVLYSLRSPPDGVDVGAIAKTFGGGGHRNAAGFTAPRAVHVVPSEGDMP
mgnify:FL=1